MNGLLPLTLAAVALSFFVSASAGLGGSLILVPTLALALGTKQGIALAALLLSGNNLVKVFAYRRSLPFRAAALVAFLTAVGAALGARLLIAVPEAVITSAVIASLAMALFAERIQPAALERAGAPVLAFGSGATSGVSGTSGPLKGVALRGLSLDRRHFVGAAALVSFVGDTTKAAVFTDAGLLDNSSYMLAAAAAPLMFAATFAGRYFNEAIGERGYSRLFWAVMGGYATRLVLTAV
ncbi:MAG: sulfite exporter TauE/SafE family protein [Chloroflexi bacterium]|nr:sulfite exporter TauE/SafE family protein [Chloroflexota bacterium]